MRTETEIQLKFCMTTTNRGQIKIKFELNLKTILMIHFNASNNKAFISYVTAKLQQSP